MKLLAFVTLIGAQCPFDGFDGESNIYDYVACRMEGGSKLVTSSPTGPDGHFRRPDDFRQYPFGVPQGTQCLKMRCSKKPSIFGMERIGCYEGQWFPLQFIPRIGFVPQFGTTITHPQCDEKPVSDNNL
jgi:hypothetical protein